MTLIRLPHDSEQKDGVWRPRVYQKSVWSYLQDGGKRAIEIWHRRSGKDEVALHWASVAAHMRVGNYWHMLPEAAQARKAVWDSIDPHRNKRRIDIAFPPEIRKNVRNSDMFIELKCGSTWQVIGSDNYNSLVGSPPIGIVFSEWAIANPSAWGYLAPIVEENDGWALFITTPRGNNHAARMYRGALGDAHWHASLLPVDRTKLIDAERLKKIKKEYTITYGRVMGNALFEQEYMCSFEAAVLGAVYGEEIVDMRKEGRVGEVLHNSSLPVETWWDLGHSDATAIWFIQRGRDGMLRAIDYEEDHLKKIGHYVKLVQNKPYVYSQHLAPHDAANETIGAKSVRDQASDLGLQMTVMPRTTLTSGIMQTRSMLSIMAIDSTKCAVGLDALSTYRHIWDEDKKILSPKPFHDWSSHGADALRTGAGSRPRKDTMRLNVKKKRLKSLEVNVI